MKRLIEFNYLHGAYHLWENNSIVFSIDESSLKFDSLKFYKGLYEGKTSVIELVYSITDDPQKHGPYIFNLLKEIIERIQCELDEAESEEIPETNAVARESRLIPLYDFAVCAGNGDYIDENIEHTGFETENMDADYALRISGNSMEPAIQDQAIILVKQQTELVNRDIAIVSVDGQLMCKRYEKRGRGEYLVPDNKEEGYREYSKKNCTSYSVLGKVIEVINPLPLTDIDSVKELY